VRAETNDAWVDAQFDDLVENVGDVAVSRNGQCPRHTPRHVANAWVTVTPMPALDLGLDARWVASRFGNTANTISDDAYSLVGAFATWRVTPRLRVTARGRNVADTVYAASVTGAPMFFPGAPRAFDVLARVTF
jgi:iron complex outermembrane receptor protein